MSAERVSDPNVFGLTGGMGSGKSTVSKRFAEKGAVILDADRIVGDLQKPNQPLLIGMVAILGEGILLDSGELDRSAAGKLMFADPERKKAIEKLIHPLVWGEMCAGIGRAGADDVVILDVPLLLETQPSGLQTRGTIVVDTEIDLAVSRLVHDRGFTEEVARDRIAKQMPREERVAHADYVITNNGSLEELSQSIEDAWSWITYSVYGP